MWKYHARDQSTSTEIHFGPAVAVVLFNDYANMEPPECYLFPKAIERVDPFLPVLKDLAESGTFLLAAMVLLNLLEVGPRTIHLPMIVAASKSWLAAFADDRAVWIDQGIGRRLCALINAVLSLDRAYPLPISRREKTSIGCWRDWCGSVLQKLTDWKNVCVRSASSVVVSVSLNLIAC
jgi:hypothetical protein